MTELLTLRQSAVYVLSTVDPQGFRRTAHWLLIL
jgi:hypothetical protein